MGLIRSRGHLPKGGYDGQNGIKQRRTTGATTVHGRVQGRRRPAVRRRGQDGRRRGARTGSDAVLVVEVGRARAGRSHQGQDRKSTRLNSSHQIISYAVFCLKKKKFIY